MNYSYLASFIIVMLTFSPIPASLQEFGEDISEEDLELIEEYIELAKGYMEENELDVALSFYEIILEIDPFNIDALNGKGLVLDNLGRYEEAISFYDKVLEIDPKNEDALSGKTLALDNLGKPEEEISNSDEVIEPEDQQFLQEISDEDLELLEEFFEQAETLFEEERYEEAISYYDKVLAIDSLDYDALYGKALALYTIGKHEEAISYYDMVLEIDSTDIDALYGKALALEGLGRADEAISNLEKITIPDLPEAEFRVPPNETINQAGVEKIAEADQTLFVIVGVFIVILISIILIDFIARRRKSMSDVETTRGTKQTYNA